jgi:hypothetical protein
MRAVTRTATDSNGNGSHIGQPGPQRSPVPKDAPRGGAAELADTITVSDHHARRRLAAAAQAGVFMAESTLLLARRSSMPMVIWEKP